MPKPYSNDLRERVVREVEAGASRRSVAGKYHVSVSFVIKLMQQWRMQGSVQPAKFGGYKGYALAEHQKMVRQFLNEKPDITLAELRDRLAEKKIEVGLTAIFRFLRHQGLSYKKNRTRQRTGT
jgi:transposase